MQRSHILCSIGFLTLLSGCGSEPQQETAPTAQETATNDADKATLMPQPVADFEGITVPQVGGIGAAASQRINAELDKIRYRAADAAKECRASAGSKPFEYRFAAEPTYNHRGVLSLRITGEVQCGGASGNMIAEAHTFDLATGAPVDVVEASGRPAAELAKLAVQGYEGEAECKTFLDGDRASLGSAFVTDRGIGVNYVVNVGAAESCTASAGLVSWDALAADLEAPLAALAQTGL